MKSVFVLQHVAREGSKEAAVQLIGVYSSREPGETAIALLAPRPGFRDAPRSFHHEEYPTDSDPWKEGFEF